MMMIQAHIQGSTTFSVVNDLRTEDTAAVAGAVAVTSLPPELRSGTIASLITTAGTMRVIDAGNVASGHTLTAGEIATVAFTDASEVALTMTLGASGQLVTTGGEWFLEFDANVFNVDDRRLYPADRCTWEQVTNTRGYDIDSARFYDGSSSTPIELLEPELGFIGKSGRFVQITQ